MTHVWNDYEHGQSQSILSATLDPVEWRAAAILYRSVTLVPLYTALHLFYFISKAQNSAFVAMWLVLQAES